MDKYILDEGNGLQYELIGDYYFPYLTVPAEEEQPIGIWGQKKIEGRPLGFVGERGARQKMELSRQEGSGIERTLWRRGDVIIFDLETTLENGKGDRNGGKGIVRVRETK